MLDTVERVVREALFFGSEGDDLYGMVHRNIGDSDVGVIICQPFADEVQRSYRPLYALSNHLAAHNILTFRFDYRGCGDSKLNHSDSTIISRIEDINTAIDFIKSRYRVKKICLLGLRLGGSLAYLAAEKNPAVDALVLWRPVINAEEYFNDCLKTNLATQMVVFQKIVHTRQKIRSMLIDGANICLDGYEISPTLYSQLSEINLLKTAGYAKIPILIVNITPEGKKADPDIDPFCVKLSGSRNLVEHCEITETSFWVDQRKYVPESKALFEKTTGWIEKLS